MLVPESDTGYWLLADWDDEHPFPCWFAYPSPAIGKTRWLHDSMLPSFEGAWFDHTKSDQYTLLPNYSRLDTLANSPWIAND